MSEISCPYCSTTMQTEVRPYAFRGVDLGRVEILLCPACGQTYYPRETSAAIEQALRDRGLFPPKDMASGRRRAVV